MIDTSEYEGHSPAPWRDTLHDGAKAHHIVDANGKAICTVHPNRETANLITDAPLLLQEVKRLREDNELYLACIHASHFRDKPGSAMSKLNQMRFNQRREEE